MTMKNQKSLIEILKAEVKPALGCTEPGALALAAAKAREVLGEHLTQGRVAVSPNIYKNGMGVGIPGADRSGLLIAACMGITGGNSNLGLNVLDSVDDQCMKEAEALADSGKVSIDVRETTDKIYIEVVLLGKFHTAKVVIQGRHDQIVLIQRDEVILTKQQTQEECKLQRHTILEEITIHQLIQEIEQMKQEELQFLLEGLVMNRKVCEAGLKNKLGSGIGYSLNKAMTEGLIGEDIITKAIIMTSAASDARMSGLKLPVMSSNGSGNHGLTAILPIAAYHDKFPQSEEALTKALAISHLVTAYIKNHTGRLSAVCGCGVAASTGAAAAVAWLMGLDYKRVEGAILNMIGNLSGMICDGAKAGCAHKLASAAGAAIQSALSAKYGAIIPSPNGIIGKTVEESIRNLAIVNNEGMAIADHVILRVMNTCYV